MSDFIDFLNLRNFAEIMREIRAEQIEHNGDSSIGIRQAINNGIKAGTIKTASLIKIADSVGGIEQLFNSDSVTDLNIRKGLRTWTDAFGEVHYDQSGFNPNPDASRYDQAQFNDIDIARKRLREQGGVVDDAYGNQKSEREIFNELIQMDLERNAETEALFEEIEPTKKAQEESGVIAVDSTWINIIERNGDGTTSIQSYSQKGTRLYTYPDASSNAFDAMNHAHRTGGSVGKAWHKEIGDSGLSEIFTTG